MILFSVSVTGLLLYVLPTCIILAYNCFKKKRNAAGASAKVKKRRFLFGRKKKSSCTASLYSQTQVSDMPKSEAPEPVLQTAKPLPPTTPSKEVEQKGTSRSKETTEEKQKVEKQEFLPYPSVRSPTKSAKRRRELELQEEKKRKIAEGFYQPRSDEDDTLEKVNSLKMENTEKTKSLRQWLGRGCSSQYNFRSIPAIVTVNVQEVPLVIAAVQEALRVIADVKEVVVEKETCQIAQKAEEEDDLGPHQGAQIHQKLVHHAQNEMTEKTNTSE
ncbi:hypothetical protein TELCIR_16891 [Teladorsagia circumcincta]|uniref:Uncharacterized protein n=1 Tax=Teladorsagia circumcincta TaxID=45464 RepID=A0A2G9TU95_TELCI|nr:hypothetical protein TELCIR_16891 [Teladorsagia circumcincta]